MNDGAGKVDLLRSDDRLKRGGIGGRGFIAGGRKPVFPRPALFRGPR